jgi:DNA-binding IclR family transcriptional regulator
MGVLEMRHAHADAIKRSNQMDAFVVKSASRILEVLEHVCDASGGTTATEITRKFGYPLSSSYALLRTLAARGYLYFDRHSRVYHPTSRISLIGARSHDDHLTGDALLRVMRDINEQTGELVVLAMLNNMQVHLIHTLEGRYAVPPHPREKEMRELTTTTSGRLFLSTLKDDHIRALVRRQNAETRGSSERTNIERLIHDVQQIRNQGYSVNISHDLPGVGGVGVLIPTTSERHRLAILIANFADKIAAQPDYYARIIRNALTYYFDSEAAPRVFHG